MAAEAGTSWEDRKEVACGDDWSVANVILVHSSLDVAELKKLEKSAGVRW